MSTAAAPSSAAPRPSASLVIVNSRNEVLLVQRNPKARAFAGAHVFPGGNYDAKQDASMPMTAIRETFEESGLLLAFSKDSLRLEDHILSEARQAIHSQRTTFQSFLAEHNLTADLNSLLPFTTWITPKNAPRRFRTEFFVVFLSTAPSTGFTSGDKTDQIPTHDGGQEIIEARFIHPEQALKDVREGKIALMPPQYYILVTLNDILKGYENTTSQREQVETLSQGAFGRMEVNPKISPERDSEGRMVLVYEGDESRGGPKGRLHRALATPGKGGILKDITLLRNFDVFTEMDTQGAKL